MINGFTQFVDQQFRVHVLGAFSVQVVRFIDDFALRVGAASHVQRVLLVRIGDMRILDIYPVQIIFSIDPFFALRKIIGISVLQT